MPIPRFPGDAGAPTNSPNPVDTGGFMEQLRKETELRKRISDALTKSSLGGAFRNKPLELAQRRSRTAQETIQRLGELGRLRKQLEETAKDFPGLERREALSRDIKTIMGELQQLEKMRARQENLQRQQEGMLGEVKPAPNTTIIPGFDTIKRELTGGQGEAVQLQDKQAAQATATQQGAASGLELQGQRIGPGGTISTFGQVPKTLDPRIIKALVGRELPSELMEALSEMPARQAMQTVLKLKEPDVTDSITAIQKASQKFLGEDLSPVQIKKLLGILTSEKPEDQEVRNSFRQFDNIQKLIDRSSVPRQGETILDSRKRLQPFFRMQEKLMSQVAALVGGAEQQLPDPALHAKLTDQLTGKVYLSDGENWIDPDTGEAVKRDVLGNIVPIKKAK